jgi:hypothetical protein
MLYSHLLLQFFFLVKLSKKSIVNLVEIVILFRIETGEATGGEEGFEFSLGDVVFVTFLHIVWIFASQDLVSVLIIPSSALWIT